MASANAFSNSFTLKPVVSQPDRTHSTTASTSSCPTSGEANGRNCSRVRSAFGVVMSPSSSLDWLSRSAARVGAVVVVERVRQVHPSLGQDRAEDLGSVLLQLLLGSLDDLHIVPLGLHHHQHPVHEPSEGLRRAPD